jgi:long-chain fatty acid transport protein
MTLHRLTLCLVAAAGLTAPGLARAQAFGLNEIGTCALARGFTGTGVPCRDASVLYWNPAGGTTLPGLSIYAGAAAVSLDGDFTADFTGREEDADIPTEVPPHAFVNYARNRLALGLGVYVPYGLTSQWEDDFTGRFAAQRASLATIYVQPTIAYEVVPGRVSIGGGPVIGHSSVELRQALDLSTARTPAGITFGQLGIAPGTEFGRASLEGDTWGLGFHFGFHMRATENLQLGARYLTEVKFAYDDAEARFTQTPTNLVVNSNVQAPFLAGVPIDQLLAPQFTGTGALTPQQVSTEIEHPFQFAVGLGYTGLANTTLALDYELFGWNAFATLPVNFERAPDRSLIENYGNGWAIRTGVEYLLLGALAARAGFSFAKTPAPAETVTPLLPDQDRYNYSVGLGIPLGRFALDLGYLIVDTQGRRGRIVERTSLAQKAAELNSGFYRLNANVLSASLKAQF